MHEHKVFTLSPKDTLKGTGKHILYLHGGAYVQSFTLAHWNFLAMLVKESKSTVTAPDYPLAPTHTYKDAFSMVSKLYKNILENVDPSELIIMGDSAGGGFALALAQMLKKENIPQPYQVILLSPWLDISLNNPEIKNIDSSDVFLGLEGLKRAGIAYAGNSSLNNFLVSPVYGSIEGLGKISLFIGTREILLPDARKLKKIAEEKGVEVNYYEYPGMFHAWMLVNLPESKKAKKQILELLK